MKKIKVFKIVVITSLSAIFITMAIFITLLCCGYKFTPLGVNNDKENQIITDEYVFYYVATTLMSSDEQTVIMEKIDMIYAIEKVGFMYKDKEVDYLSVKNNNNIDIGKFIEIKGKSCYYNFYLNLYYTDMVDGKMVPNEYVNHNFKVLTIDSEAQEVFNHCYFTTKNPVINFNIDGEELQVIRST